MSARGLNLTVELFVFVDLELVVELAANGDAQDERGHTAHNGDGGDDVHIDGEKMNGDDGRQQQEPDCGDEDDYVDAVGHGICSMVSGLCRPLNQAIYKLPIL